MENLLDELKKALKADGRLMIEGKLAKNKIIELSLALDKSLIKLLLKNITIKKHFFRKVDDVLVFAQLEFHKFVSNKQFLPDSYTAFKNKIGLTVNGEYLTEAKEVVLSWPYKDCVLEGGQTKEDEKRKEIFWNETLAPGEIERLFSPKVLTNFKHYDKNGKQKVGKLSISDNLIIRGNNLLAIHSLKKVYEGKVKLIYIDPPYNTGNDEFLYNDSFNQSTWLTFMINRLQVAKDLLADDGSIYISIDENEIGILQVLMDEIFGIDNRSNIVTVKRGSVTGHKAINPGVVNITEYIVSYTKNSSQWEPNRLYKKRDRNQRYNNFILNRNKPISKWKICSLLDEFSKFKEIPKSILKKSMGSSFEPEIFKFIKDNADAVIQPAYPDKSKVSKDVISLIEQSEANPNKIYHKKRTAELDIYLLNGKRLLFYGDRLKEIEGELVTAEPLSDLWDDVLPNDLHNEGGVTLKKGKKPEKLIGRIVELATKPGDLVCDFFIGSGTTAAVCLKLDRKFIGVEQLDYGINDCVVRLNNTIKGEQSGISKTVNWKGGSSFNYCELKKSNAEILDEIEAAKSSKGLIKIWEQLQNKTFISYKIDLKTINKHKTSFSKLSIEEQKAFLVEVLDKNHLYVNYSDIEDKDFKVSKEEIKLNHQFYSLK
jgi:adenine-specific DNA-methyltransferase